MKTPSTVGSVKSTPRKMNDVSTPKSKRKIDLRAIVEEENDTELPDILCFHTLQRFYLLFPHILSYFLLHLVLHILSLFQFYMYLS
jgi:hypothetical protein